MSTAQVVFKQLKDDFPSQDAKWVLNSDVSWSQLTSVPLARIDLANKTQWNAYGNTAKLKKFMHKIQTGDRKPVILARIKGNPKLVVLDGHHRTLASDKLNTPVRSYIATITGSSEKDALDMHNEQRKGNSGVKATELKFTAETPVVSTVHSPFGSPSGPGLWHMKGKQLPAYIQQVAKGLLRKGHAAGESDAIHKAVGIVKDWAAGRTPNGKGHVHPDVQAAAQRAIAEWYKLRGERASRTAAKTFSSEMVELANDYSLLTARDFHKVPAAMRRYRKQLEKQGIPKDQALKQTVAVFKKLQSSKNPVLKGASKGNLQSLNRRKSRPANGGSAGGDTGINFKQLKMSNQHHGAAGKFAGNPKERERILRVFQEQHNLPVSGIIDEDTRDALRTMNKAANDDSN